MGFDKKNKYEIEKLNVEIKRLNDDNAKKDREIKSLNGYLKKNGIELKAPFG